jgi:hypothetical protein
MRTLRIPRDGSTILSMLLALAAVTSLPFVFMAALASSTDMHPRPLASSLSELTHPVTASAGALWDRAASRVRR